MKTSQVQRELKVKTSNLLKAREDAGEQVKNGFSFEERWRELSWK